MERKELEEKIRGLVCEYSIPNVTVKDDSRFIEDLGMDSLDMIDIASKCEMDFDIEIELDYYRENETFSKLVDLIENKINNSKTN